MNVIFKQTREMVHNNEINTPGQSDFVKRVFFMNDIDGNLTVTECVFVVENFFFK